MENQVTSTSYDHLCHGCHHLTKSRGKGVCCWCGSSDIYLHRTDLAEKMEKAVRHKPRVYSRPQQEEPSVFRTWQYPYHYRLARGFAIMHGGSV